MMMKLLFLIWISANIKISTNAVVSRFYPIKLERQNNDDNSIDEYLFEINNKYYHAVLKADEYMKYPMKYAINGEEPKLYYHDYKCFKKGYIKNSLESRILLNDCQGLRGILSFENNSFFVKPSEKYGDDTLQRQLSFEKIDSIEHVLEAYDEYNEESECMVSETEKIDIETYDTEKQIQYTDPHFSVDPKSRSTTRLLEISLIVLSETVNHFNNDLKKVFDLMTLTSYYTNYFLNDMNVVPVIKYMEIFNGTNPYGPIGPNDFINGGSILDHISKYRVDYLQPKNEQYDITVLLSHRIFHHAVGWAYVNTICNSRYSIVYARILDAARDVSILSHEYGHQFGFSHTNYNNPNCTCPKRCVMDAFASSTPYFQSSWSNCELDRLKTVMTRSCFNNHNPKTPVDPIFCGNEKIEKGEECDCGFASDCAKTEEIKCCDPVVCRLYPGNSCSKGDCCSKCLTMTNNSTCYSPRFQCFVGYCDGTAEGCQKKEMLPFGTSCGNKDVCHYGECKKYQSQCQEYFGTELANDQCFHEFNSRGDATGNCGILDKKTNKYIKCLTEDDYLCGKIVCKINPNMPFPDKYNISIFNNTCGVLYSEDPEEYTLMMVPDGTSCGANKICFKHRCYDELSGMTLFLKSKCGLYANVNKDGECVCIDGYYSNQIRECFLKSIPLKIRSTVVIIYVLVEIMLLITFSFLLRKYKFLLLQATKRKFGNNFRLSL